VSEAGGSGNKILRKGTGNRIGFFGATNCDPGYRLQN